ncbi:MAG: DUF4192 family protein [Microbacterium sp.]|uniref:DUF4192 family protein n=1 Tax=Microbacterium sp. TaxID=51671 RepID=UPI0039E4AAF3
MTTIVKAADAAQFLSLVPAMFGFTPTRSIVIVPFAGGRSVGGMRVDIPPDDHVDAVAATLIGMVCRVEDAEAYALAVFDDEPADAELPHVGLATALRARADACGIDTIDALYVGPDRWGSYLDASAGGDAAALRAPGPASAFVPLPGEDQRSGAVLVRAPKPDRERAATALRELERAVHVLAGGPPKGASSRIHPTALATAALLDDLPEFFDSVVRRAASGVGADVGADDRARHDAYARAALMWCLRRPALRDIGLATWLDGAAAGDAALEAQLRWEGGEPYSERIGRRMSGEGPQPDAERLRAALDACREAASVAPRGAQAGVLSACAWLSWALGRMTHAEVYARHAVGIEPGHGMGMIVLGLVGAGHLPDWAFRRPQTT